MGDKRNDDHANIVPNKTNYQVIPISEKELLQQKLPPQTQPSKPKSSAKAVFHQIISTCAVLLLSAACGMPIGYSAVLLPQLVLNASNSTNDIVIDNEMGSWIASVHSLATPAGSILSGPMADSFGRRNALLVAVFPILCGWIILALSHSYLMLIAGRMVTGFAVGILGGPAQVYIAETTDPTIRSLLIGTPFFSYSIGILIVYALGSSMHWRTVAWCGNALPILAAIALCLIPESPVWLLRNNKTAAATKSLMFLRGNKIAAQKELNVLIERLDQEKATSKTNENIFKLCCQRIAIKPLFIVIIFSFLQMLSGTFLVVFYAIDIIAEFGADFDTKKAAVWTAIVRTACSLIFCMVLLVIRRRHITIISCIGSGFSALFLSIFMYLRLNQPKTEYDILVAGGCLFSYIAFNTPLMIMPGIMIGELFPAKIRGRTGGAIFAACNVALFCLAKAFPMVQTALKMQGVFMIFGISSFMAAVFMFLMQPETKGKTLEQIEDYFNQRNWFWFTRDKSYKKTSQDVKP